MHVESFGALLEFASACFPGYSDELWSHGTTLTDALVNMPLQGRFTHACRSYNSIMSVYSGHEPLMSHICAHIYIYTYTYAYFVLVHVVCGVGMLTCYYISIRHYIHF